MTQRRMSTPRANSPPDASKLENAMDQSFEPLAGEGAWFPFGLAVPGSAESVSRVLNHVQGTG